MSEPQKRPPLRPLLDEIRTANEVVESHRRNLIERIGQLRAMADDREAEAMTLEKMGRDAGPQRTEVARLNEQAQMLAGRVNQLMAELYGTPGSAPQATQEVRKAWQRPEWWAQLQVVNGALQKTDAAATLHAEKIGLVCRQEIDLSVACCMRILATKPEDLRSVTLESVSELQTLADRIAPIPWNLLDIDSQSGAQLVLTVRHLCKDMPPTQEVYDLREECARRFDVLLDSMQGHKEAGRLESARQHFKDGSIPLAYSIVSGIAPPDPLRYEVNKLAFMIGQG